MYKNCNFPSVVLYKINKHIKRQNYVTKYEEEKKPK